MSNFFEEAAKRMDQFEWKPCPSCHNEFNGLFVMRFVDGKNQPREVELCGECKSFVPGIEYAKTFIPLPGAIITRRQMGTLGDRMLLAAIVDFNGQSVTVLPHPAGGFTFKLANDPKKVTHRGFDCFDTWIKIRNLLPSPQVQALPVPVVAKGFGGLRKFNFDQA